MELQYAGHRQLPDQMVQHQFALRLRLYQAPYLYQPSFPSLGLV